MNGRFKISISYTTRILCIFVAAQLSMWYGGLADLISDTLLSSWNVLQQWATVGVILLFLLSKRLPNILSIVLILARLWLCFVTWFNGREIEITYVTRFVCLILLVDYFSKNAIALVSAIMPIFEFMVYYNLLTCIQNGPDLFGAFYGALGYDNDFTRYLIAGYFWAMLYSKILKKLIRPLLLLMAIHATLIFTWCGTGLMAILVVDALLLAFRFFQMDFSIIKGYIGYLLAVLFIVFFRFQNMFSYFIEDVLKKDLTFTGRTKIWDSAILLIRRNPILGYGYMNQESEIILLGGPHTHNILLEQLLRAGVVYVILFATMLFLLDAKLKKAKKYLRETDIITMMSLITVSVWLAGITENIMEDYILYLLFSTLFVLPDMIEQRYRLK